MHVEGILAFGWLIGDDGADLLEDNPNHDLKVVYIGSEDERGWIAAHPKHTYVSYDGSAVLILPGQLVVPAYIVQDMIDQAAAIGLQLIGDPQWWLTGVEG